MDSAPVPVNERSILKIELEFSREAVSKLEADESVRSDQSTSELSVHEHEAVDV